MSIFDEKLPQQGIKRLIIAEKAKKLQKYNRIYEWGGENKLTFCVLTIILICIENPLPQHFCNPKIMWRNLADLLSNYIGVLGYFFLCHIFCILVLYFIKEIF